MTWRTMPFNILIFMSNLRVISQQIFTGSVFAHYPSKHLSWWRRLEDVFRLQRLQDVLTKTNIFTHVIHLQKTSSSRCLAKTSSKRLQDVFKTSCENVFKTSSRRLRDVFNTFLSRTAKTITYRKICLGSTSENVWPLRLQNFQQWTLLKYQNF